MVQAFVDIKDDRVDKLYARPPLVLARVQFGSELKGEQLSSFGRVSRTYSILGQVVAGYFSLPRRWVESRDGPERLAATFQIVEARGLDGEVLTRLNAIVGGVSQDEWNELLLEDPWAGVNHAFAEARDAVEEMQSLIHAARERREGAEVRRHFKQVPRILHKLARSLEQGSRKGTRRTRHGSERGMQRRPVYKALDDARAAGDEDLFFDKKTRTRIVRGPKGRAHAFNDQGKLVTSFVLPPNGVDFRVRTGRWRPLDKEEIGPFRTLLQKAELPANGEAEADDAAGSRSP
jgi:hypothetical protein